MTFQANELRSTDGDAARPRTVCHQNPQVLR